MTKPKLNLFTLLQPELLKRKGEWGDFVAYSYYEWWKAENSEKDIFSDFSFWLHTNPERFAKLVADYWRTI